MYDMLVQVGALQGSVGGLSGAVRLAPAPACQLRTAPTKPLTPLHLPAGSTLPQEIKAAKLQQKLLARSVAELARNGTAAYAELSADLAALAARLAKVRGCAVSARQP